MSLTADAILKLAAHGLTIEQIADVARVNSTTSDSAIEKRRAYDRERKRKAKDGNSTGIPPESAEANSTGIPPEFHRKTPPLARVEDNPSKIITNISEPKGSSIAMGKPEKGSRLPEDWEPPPECFDYAAEKGFTLLEAQGEFSKFRNHWLGESGQRARKSRWDFTFRKWLDNASDYRSRSGARMASGARPSGGGQGVADFASIAARRRGFT